MPTSDEEVISWFDPNNWCKCSAPIIEAKKVTVLDVIRCKTCNKLVDLSHPNLTVE
jgi:hypothetical protein